MHLRKHNFAFMPLKCPILPHKNVIRRDRPKKYMYSLILLQKQIIRINYATE